MDVDDIMPPRITRDHYEVHVIRNGEVAPIPTRCDLLSEAREVADRMAAGLTPHPVIVELDWRQPLSVVDDRDAVVIETCRILNQHERIFE